MDIARSHNSGRGGAVEVWSRMQRAYQALKTPSHVAMNDTGVKFDGLIRAYELPFDSYEEYLYWWIPEVKVEQGQPRVTRPARMKTREKKKYLVAEHHNLLTQLGRSQLLGFIGSPVYISTQTAFAQYFAVGTYSPFAGATSGDTVVNGEIARNVPSAVTLTGTQADISTYFSTSQGNGTWTNCGLFGNNATSTLSSGTLMTHSAFAYTKSSSNPVTCDYLINLL